MLTHYGRWLFWPADQEGPPGEAGEDAATNAPRSTDKLSTDKLTAAGAEELACWRAHELEAWCVACSPHACSWRGQRGGGAGAGTAAVVSSCPSVFSGSDDGERNGLPPRS
jgi:hypothetical protein